MAKDPSPKADGLRAMREARFSTAVVETDKAERLEALRKAAEQKSRPYAGKISKGEAAGPRTAAAKARAEAKAVAKEEARKARKRVKHTRRTVLPPEREPKS